MREKYIFSRDEEIKNLCRLFYMEPEIKEELIVIFEY